MDFDVFLCHHGSDKEAVKEIGLRLRAAGLRPWLDEWELQPGQRWQNELERQIATIPAVAVFVGPRGFGPWQNLEVEAFLRQAVKRVCPIIPVILPGTVEAPALPLFLEGYTWVNFLKTEPDPFGQLLWGIRGSKAGLREEAAPKRKLIRLHSTRDSVKNGEVSVLAVLETVAAVSLVFYLTSYLATLEWLAVAICIAPLLLLRTEESTQLGIQYFDSMLRVLDKLLDRFNSFEDNSLQIIFFGPWVWLFFFSWGIAAVLARVGATVVATLRNSGKALRAIPGNWARVALATDSLSHVEPLPDHVNYKDGFLAFFKKIDFKPEDDLKSRVVLLSLLFLLLAPIFIPAFLYRWSLKATSIIYAPFVFVAHQTFAIVGNVRDDLRLRKDSSISKLSVVLGCILIVAFVAKVVFIRKAQTFIDWWNSREVGEFLGLYVAPTEIPKWQLSSLLNSVLAIAMFFFVREALVRIENNLPWPETVVRRTLGFTYGLRVVLSTYTILCMGYITIRAAQHWDLPAIAEKWFPWQ